MKILFDQGTPVPLRDSLGDHEVATAFERGWDALQNGDLLQAAESQGFAAIVTTDQNLRYQQNLPLHHLEQVASAIAAIKPGAYIEVHFPPPP